MMDDKQFRVLDIASRIAPGLASWPITEHMHWAHLKTAAVEARSRLEKFYEQRDEIESDPRLSREGKAQERRKAGEKALAALDKSPALRRAQDSVASLMEKWEAKVGAAVRPAAKRERSGSTRRNQKTCCQSERRAAPGVPGTER